jgi:SAM-dependent methyltransferase
MRTEDAKPPTPELFWETLTAFQRSAAIKTAIELDLFTAIADGAVDAPAIGGKVGASTRGIRILCDALSVMGFLVKEQGTYKLTNDSAVFLSRRSPAYVGGAADFILSPMQVRGFDLLTGAVRSGGSTVTGEDSLDPESPMWVRFAEGMAPMMVPAARAAAENFGIESDKSIKILDIAAGHGIYGIVAAQKYTASEVFAVDWSNVLQVAKSNAAKFGVENRYHSIAGSAFDVEFGSEYDVVLLPNFLHHFDAATNEQLLRKIYAALRADGKVITVEFIPNDDRVSPPAESMFSLVMLAATPAGDAYTFPELRQMFEAAGFSRNEHVPLPPLPQHLVISMK